MECPGKRIASEPSSEIDTGKLLYGLYSPVRESGPAFEFHRGRALASSVLSNAVAMLDSQHDFPLRMAFFEISDRSNRVA